MRSLPVTAALLVALPAAVVARGGTPPGSLCDAGRQVHCRSAERSRLVIESSAVDAKDVLAWQWRKGAATALTDLGAPTDTTAYALCLYAGGSTAAIAGADVGPSASLWHPAGKTGFAYDDSSGSADGVRQMTLKSGAAGMASVVVRGRGAGLPDLPPGALPLPVTVQLVQAADDACFEATYDGAAVTKNDGEGFRARARATTLYVSASGTLDGKGSVASPYRRITDAVERARADRASGIGASQKTIQIRVAPGSYVGSYDTASLQSHPDYEVLPIILNVSGLAVLGSTSLLRDGRGLPAAWNPETETSLQSADPLGADQSLFLIASTTDGSMGNGVTVDGFVLDGSGGPIPQAFPHFPVMVDRVSGFRIGNNVIRHGNFGILTRLASGTIEGNLLTLNEEAGGFVHGGSLAHPSTVVIRANRISANGQHGIMALAVASDLPADPGTNALGLEPLQATFDRNDPEDLQNLHDTLVVTLSDNDFRAYGVFGIRMMTVIPRGNLPECSGGIGYGTPDADQPLTGAITAEVTGNTFSGNGFYGVGMEGGFPCRSDPRPIVATFAASFEGNSFAASNVGPALFTFNAWGPTLGFDSLQTFKFEENSAYQVTDPDGELSGFDYDHPLTDPISAAVLGNILTVNGVAAPHGTKLTPP